MLSPVTCTVLIAIATVILPASGQIQVIRPDESRIQRPCHGDDVQCIKREFKHKNWCDNKYRAQPPSQPLKIPDTITVQLPVVNVTVIQNDYVFTGFGKGKMEDFYINPVTNKALLVVNYKKTDIKLNTVILYHRTGKEDIQIVAPKATEQYDGLKITTIISGLTSSPTFSSFVEIEGDMNYSLGDGTINMTDPDVMTLLKYVNEHVDFTAREAIISKTDFIVKYYIQNIICQAH